jgi:hypothetical protein
VFPHFDVCADLDVLTRYPMANAITYLVRVTTDDRAHQLWVVAASSDDEALTLVLNAVPEGWTAALLPNRLKPMEIDALALKGGEVREISAITSVSAVPRPATH